LFQLGDKTRSLAGKMKNTNSIFPIFFIFVIVVVVVVVVVFVAAGINALNGDQG